MNDLCRKPTGLKIFRGGWSRSLAGLLALSGLLAADVQGAVAADPAPVIIQWNAEVLGKPVDVVWSTDGRFVTASWAKGEIIRWNASTGKRMPSDEFTTDQAIMKGRTSELWFKHCRILSPAFSPSGTTKLASRSIGIADPASGKIKAIPFEFEKSFRFPCADVSPDGSKYAIAGDVVYLVNSAGKTLKKLTPELRPGQPPPDKGPVASTTSPVLGLAFSSDGKHLAAIDRPGTITVWETASGKVTAVLPGHPLKVNNPPVDLVWFNDNTLLTPNVIVDRKLQRWNIDTQKADDLTWTRKNPNQAPPKKKGKPAGPPPGPPPDYVIAGWDGTTRHFYGAIAFSPDGKRAAYAFGRKQSEGRSNNELLVIVDLTTRLTMGAIELDPDDVQFLQFSRDSQSLLVASRWGWNNVVRIIPMKQVEAMAEAGLPLSSADAGLDQNPEVASWKRFKPGDYLQHDVTLTYNGRTATGMVTHNLREVYDDQSGIEVGDSMSREVTDLAGPTVLPLSRIRTIPLRLATDMPKTTVNPILGQFEGKMTPQGKETLKVGNDSYECEIIKFDGVRIDADGYRAPTSGKFWSCPDVPGLVVKSTSTSKLRSELKLEMMLKQIVRK